MNWEYIQPVRIVFGAGRRLEIKTHLEALGIKKALLVCGGSMVRGGYSDELISAADGMIVGVFSGVNPNPTVDNVNSCADMMRELCADGAVAMGGGSVIDCAKAACGIAPTNDKIEKYHFSDVPIPNGALPLIAIPTTAGTGSEVTCVSVLSNETTHVKGPVLSPNFYAQIAIVDPELTYSLQKKITVSTGFDVLSHAIEGFYSKNHQPISDALCVYAAQLVFNWLEAACADEPSHEAREKMVEASLIAGLGFNLPKTGPSHACSFVLTNQYHIPHGEACILTQDTFIRIIAASDGGRLNDFAHTLGFGCADAMSDRIFEMKQKLGMRTDLKDFKLNDTDVESLVKASRHPNMNNSPVPISDEMLFDMYNNFR